MVTSPPGETPRAKVKFGAFRALKPYVLAYRWRILAALCALLVASMATLALPMAVRRVIDTGFSGGREELADAY
ncbi:MAG: ABC transporter, partial [Bosea sp. (in: a-proteobacteria)]